VQKHSCFSQILSLCHSAPLHSLVLQSISYLSFQNSRCWNPDPVVLRWQIFLPLPGYLFCLSGEGPGTPLGCSQLFCWPHFWSKPWFWASVFWTRFMLLPRNINIYIYLGLVKGLLALNAENVTQNDQSKIGILFWLNPRLDLTGAWSEIQMWFLTHHSLVLFFHDELFLHSFLW
jgi:hypothetical protein